ncbi:MAG TPA: hypothetical protein VNP95_03460 [Thermomicrobiales bacterium]|nr:hypothetical protein [Thermomicrobiales bacterium]
MLPMNTDLIDTLIFERQFEIQQRMHRLSIATAEPHPLWSRTRAAVRRLLASGSAVSPQVTRPDVIPVSTDRPAALVFMHAPAPIEDEALDRAA